MATLKEKKDQTGASAQVENGIEQSKKSAKKIMSKKDVPAIGEKEAKKAMKVSVKKDETNTTAANEPIVAKKPAKAKAKKAADGVPALAEAITAVKEKITKKAVKKLAAIKETIVPVVNEVVATPTADAIETNGASSVTHEPVVADTKVAQANDTLPVATAPAATKRVTFQLRYNTSFGQHIYLTGNNTVLGNGDVEQAVALQYFDNQFWFAEVEFESSANETISYNYLVVNPDGSYFKEAGNAKKLSLNGFAANDVLVLDSWNDFADFALSTNAPTSIVEGSTHIFSVNATELPEQFAVFVTGNTTALGNWNEENVLLLQKAGNVWTAGVNIEETAFEYKYGIYDTVEKSIVELEGGENRVFYTAGNSRAVAVIADGLVYVADFVSEAAV